ncbi:hypothetical protein A2765_00315 [Candidatus Kaiserbacteria bacterium RIFCSPHIGHO2_01_FULL_56_24]|uniref:Uncharacterized protein n=1 Tax=Candidatus Kaiserbacteria bacterium RIFCSPHIGHO2_01_FULL_56_24 TaxID=1798487 RepID=A0A1F6DFS6_9BACT|nr:MAG: hypothetical protein A2765_00315 [Candidatus Kaiserbacteria bacterium RIFCSPHIGHO2_01_FULL_56_24]
MARFLLLVARDRVGLFDHLTGALSGDDKEGIQVMLDRREEAPRDAHNPERRQADRSDVSNILRSHGIALVRLQDMSSSSNAVVSPAQKKGVFDRAACLLTRDEIYRPTISHVLTMTFIGVLLLVTYQATEYFAPHSINPANRPFDFAIFRALTLIELFAAVILIALAGVVAIGSALASAWWRLRDVWRPPKR